MMSQVSVTGIKFNQERFREALAHKVTVSRQRLRILQPEAVTIEPETVNIGSECIGSEPETVMHAPESMTSEPDTMKSEEWRVVRTAPASVNAER
eukprot:3437243-Rhodomonas_salina.2